MNAKYKEEPLNYDDIKAYVIADKNDVINAFFKGENYFFYDTCSIQHHSNSENRSYIIKYLLSKSATIILTRTVLMELCPNSFMINPIQISYLKELHHSGLKILLFNEEYIYYCLKEYLSITIQGVNSLLGYAVKETSKYKSAVNEILNSLDYEEALKYKGVNIVNKEIYSSFFEKARTNKKENDSLAEELMFICIIVLARLPLKAKYVFFSNDLKIREKIIRVSDYIYKHLGKKEPYQLTTASLIYKMNCSNILKDREKMLEILSKCCKEGKILVYYNGEFDINTVLGSFGCEELVDRVVGDNQFKVMY